MGRILSIDYGRKRIGLAMSDEDEFLAFTLSHITSGSQDKLFGQLIAKIKEMSPKELLIGYPLGIDLKPTQMSIEVDKFISELEIEIKLKIIKWNEVGTSKIAQSNLRAKGNKKGNIDSESARIILQEYLDFKTEK